MSTTMPDARTDPADCCQPWCWAQTRGTGHVAFVAGEVLECWTDAENRVSLSTEPLIDGDFDAGAPGMVPDFVSVYLWKVEGEPTTVTISRHNLAGIDFTPAEARELAAKLVSLAEAAQR